LPFAPAAATSHLGLFAVVLLVGFAIGVFGHIIRSRLLILAGIAVIAFVSLYLVGAGEVQTLSP
jgi:hypothetical protein